MSIPKFGILDQFSGLFSKLTSFRISGFSSGFSGFFQDSFVVLWDFSGFLGCLEIPWDSLEIYIWALFFTFLQANYYWEIDGIFLYNSICQNQSVFTLDSWRILWETHGYPSCDEWNQAKFGRNTHCWGWTKKGNVQFLFFSLVLSIGKLLWQPIYMIYDHYTNWTLV